MSDNVGLATPRGSGTSGYVQRNLAHMRPRDMGAPYAPRDSDSLRHRPRQPDQGLLEHDRKREVEVKVFELRDKLEEEGCVYLTLRTGWEVDVWLTDLGDYRVDEEDIESRCDELRKKLLADMEKNQGRRGGGVGPAPRKSFKMHQVHELADAKIKESERLRQALKISKDYEEGSHWRRQEERLKKALERETGDGKDERDAKEERESEYERDGERHRSRDRSYSR